MEADETFLGGPEPGVRGRGAQGKVMVEVAVEQVGRGLGRCRLQVIPDVAGPTLREFMLAHVEPLEDSQKHLLRIPFSKCREQFMIPLL